MAIGFVAGILCFFTATRVKKAFGYDDSLDVFGVHAVGGIVGALLTGVFCAEILGGAGFGGDNTTLGGQLLAQSVGVLVTSIYTALVSLLILKLLDAAIGLRVDEDQETEGLDIALHNERGYII
uniref:Ammonium transporter, Amt family n=1 Tax=Candidatus Kentrum sp. TC TaxID=2126339 RepID=A0A450ZTC7_9GAMM|nr:MAG: ammonium transporter, Amt family [Candidatus Kentron sp. TC]